MKITTIHYWTRITARLLLALAGIGLLISPLVLLQADKNYQLRHDALFTEKRLYVAFKHRVVAQYDHLAALYVSAEMAENEKVLFAKVPMPWKECASDRIYSYGSCVTGPKPTRQIAAGPQIYERPLKRPALHVMSNSKDKTIPVESSPAAVQQIQAPAPSSVLTVVQQLKGFHDSSECVKGITDVVVAHQDDDILFMNPDLANDITAGRCVRTVYVTAGDAGESSDYWGGRENGAKAAYAAAFNLPDTWQDTTELIAGKGVTVSTLRGAPTVALVFLRLPDGNLHGKGFASTGMVSLQKLLNGTVAGIETVDGANTFMKNDVTTALDAIFSADAPDKIYTLGLASTADGDHSDHLAVSQFTKLALAAYQGQFTLTTYGGYPEKLLVPNLSEQEMASKQAMFFAYAKYDAAVCRSSTDCAQTDTYSNYLTRQYKADVPVTAVR